MSMLSNLELIRRVPLFAFLTPSQADVVAQAVVKRRFRRGALVMRQGERSNTLFIILTGRVRVVAADQRGREVTLAIRQAGHHIGEMSLIDKEPHSATVRAEVQTDMLALGGAEFTHCLQASPSMAYALLRGLVQAASGPQDRVVRVHGCLRTSCPCPAGVSRHRQSRCHGGSRAHLAPGHRQDGWCLARNGQPRDDGFGRPGVIETCVDGSILIKDKLLAWIDAGQ